jgi:hypothetical protein
MSRALLILVVPVAALVFTATPAEAATPQLSLGPSLACPGVLCSPFWKTNPDFILRRVP